MNRGAGGRSGKAAGLPQVTFARSQGGINIYMYAEDDLLPISALQHLLFCERQCALIHVERLWAENRLTIEGRHLHKRVHGDKAGPRGGGMSELRAGVRIVRALPIRSLRLGLAGVADVVEFVSPDSRNADIANIKTVAERQERDESTAARESIHALSAYGIPLPVEYKRGKSKRLNWDRVQVCAQALCLEEMLGVEIPEAAIFYGATRRRERVPLEADLRGETETAAARLRHLVDRRITPAAIYERKCERCSLINLCLPRVTTGARSAGAYVRREMRSASPMDDGAKAGGPQ